MVENGLVLSVVLVMHEDGGMKREPRASSAPCDRHESKGSAGALGSTAGCSNPAVSIQM